MNWLDWILAPEGILFHPRKIRLWNDLQEDSGTWNFGNQMRYETLLDFPLNELNGENYETKLNVIRTGCEMDSKLFIYCFMAGGSETRTPEEYFNKSIENSLKEVSKRYLQNKPLIDNRVNYLVKRNFKPSEDYLSWTYKNS